MTFFLQRKWVQLQFLGPGFPTNIFHEFVHKPFIKDLKFTSISLSKLQQSFCVFLPEGGREPLPLPNQARHHEASEQQDGSVPQGGEPDEPPQGQDEPSAGQVPRQHQEAPKLTGPGKGISGGRTSVVCWWIHSSLASDCLSDQFVGTYKTQCGVSLKVASI